MSYNHRKDFLRFESELRKEIEFFSAAGMKPEDIKIIEEYTRQQHNKDRVYNERNIPLYTYLDEGRNLYANLSINAIQKRKSNQEISSLDWINNFNNNKIKNYIKKLKKEWQIILTEIAINDKTITEVAEKLGRDRKTIRKIYNTMIEEIKIIMS